MKIATWNIAGIRARIETLLSWLKEYDPDIVCLQEIKAEEKNFPFQPIEDLGYHIEIFGQKAFNGVAILSKKTPDEIIKNIPNNENDPQARFLEAVFSSKEGSFRVCCLYAPNGNPIESEKYTYKLEWMKKFITYAQHRISFKEPIFLAGDFNIIAQNIDAKKPEIWKNDALFQPEVREFFFQLTNAGYYDAVRAYSDEPSYTFWDFQKQAFAKDNGIRIDYFLISPEAMDLLKKTETQKSMRAVNKPSDHVPVLLELEMTF